MIAYHSIVIVESESHLAFDTRAARTDLKSPIVAILNMPHLEFASDKQYGPFLGERFFAPAPIDGSTDSPSLFDAAPLLFSSLLWLA